jgi:DNA-binding PadR family transcriptional regulator
MALPDPAEHLPLRPTDLHLLLALAGEDLHGYALVQAIETGTNGLIRLDPGNLYRVIKRLLAAGLVAESSRRASSDPGSERRRYYRITPSGRKALAQELRRLDALLRPTAVRAIMREAL